jgi:CRP/FNR family transcriptional regulator
MNTTEIQNLLHTNFSQIAEVGLQDEIARVGRVYTFPAGETIMDYGSYVRMVPLLISGTIKVMKTDEDEGREILLYYINSGETCSMSFTCCMMHKKSDIRTEAVDDTKLIGIPIQYVDQWMVKYQSWKNFIMLSYDKRMKELIDTINLIAFKRMDERLLDYLQKKAATSDDSIVHSSHQNIAYDLNASREAISRLLKQLENAGRIKLGRNKIELL